MTPNELERWVDRLGRHAMDVLAERDACLAAPELSTDDDVVSRFLTGLPGARAGTGRRKRLKARRGGRPAP